LNTQIDRTQFGRLIRDSRVRLGLSQRKLGELIDKRASTISRWEKGERRPKPDSILKLSNVLGIRIQKPQSLAGYSPESNWYAWVFAQPGSPKDILLGATGPEKESLEQYLHFLRFQTPC
jgi:transcriptional regulator with XRE-family HTH domain